MTTPDPAVPESEPVPEPQVTALEVSGPTGVVLDALRLQPDPTDPDLFTGTSLPQPNGRVFGGQVLAQALLAAGATVEPDRLPHSLHGYFLRAGVIDEPITFAVERMRDGRSFTARRTHALQRGVPILSMIASFQVEQEGIEYAEEKPHGVPEPEDVRSVFDVLGPIDHPVAKFWSQESAFDVRHVEGGLYLGPAPERTGRQMVWIKARSPLPDDPMLHRALLAYACDQVMLEPVLRRAGRSWVTPGMAIASLDHAMWWHRDVRVDDWLLYVQSTPSAQGGRGLGAARVFTRDGTLVASIAQEGMVRVP